MQYSIIVWASLFIFVFMLNTKQDVFTALTTPGVNVFTDSVIVMKTL